MFDVESGLLYTLLGIGVAALTSAVLAGLLLSVKLLQMTEWQEASVARTWKAGSRLFLEYMACEAVYVAVAAVAAIAIGPTRPVDFEVVSRQHKVLTWVAFGVLMTLFGTRLLSGAVERLFPELDESAAKQRDRWRKRMEIRAGIFVAARRSLAKRIVDVHFVQNAGPLQLEMAEIRDPIEWAIDRGLVKYERIEASLQYYLKVTDFASPAFVAELTEQIKRGGVETSEYSLTLVDKILLGGYGVSLKRLSEECRYLQSTEVPDDDIDSTV